MVGFLLSLLFPLLLWGLEVCTLSFDGLSGTLGLLKCQDLKPATYRVEVSLGKVRKSFTYTHPSQRDFLPFAVPFFWKGNIKLTLYRNDLKLARVTLRVKPLQRGVSRIMVSYKAGRRKVSEHYSLIRRVLRTYTPVRYYEAQPLFPLKSYKRISSPFGVRRFVNGRRAGFHKGLDLAAPYGEPILASLSGRVVLARNLSLTGKTVVIDHGWGLMTLYAHLSRIEVREGKLVKRGEVIGRVGSSGRSTGPHLHFGVYLNDTAVDPLQFLKMILRPAEGGVNPPALRR
jgi:murein DD-endopeptidase MepM/ murein hydrolase activator NlpD